MNQIESIIARVKGIILTPKTEWLIISKEKKTTSAVFRRYLLPLSVISVIACYIGYGIVGSNQGMFGPIATAELGYRNAAFNVINLIISPFISASIISFLAPSFNAERNFSKAFKLVVYSYTPMLVGSILYILPSLSPIVLLAGIYGLYIQYLGLIPMTKAAGDKTSVYFAVSLLTTIVVYFFISLILTPILVR
jgi:hypothetical protein